MRALLCISLALPFALSAQKSDGTSASASSSTNNFGHKVAVPSAMAARRTSPITLDAKLDEAAWQTAQPITDFRQIDPEEGKPASQRTDVRFLFDDDALYIGAKMYDSEGGKGVITRLVRRDDQFDSDFFEIVIDGYHDHLSRAFFDLNPSGSKSDYIGIGTSCCDNSWDPVWEAATHVDADGWTAEIRIPYSQLRFSRDSAQTWGLQVRRFIKRRDEQDQWAFWGKTEAGGPSRFGHLEGLRIPSASSHLEVLPYLVSKASSVGSTPGDPFDNHGRPTMRAGLDLKDRLTSNLTLDATVNPDFGQVEVDPAVLNLSAFETFFPEKRPFFVEGAQIFNFGGMNCNFCSNVEGMSSFYSRRIGRAPTGASLATDPNEFADVPDATTILAAGKITGRTASGYTVGLLNAVTGKANARVQTPTGDRAKQEVEPLANYFIGRLKRDYMNGNLVVGGVMSGVARQIDADFAPRLARHAEMYGNDVYYTWNDHMYSFRAQGALTNVSGDPREILLRERSSARYFQRPDRGSGSGGFLSNRFDSSATALRGAGGYARIAKETGDWFGEMGLNTRTPGYETNDYAFQQRADYIWYNANIGRTWTKPTSWYRSIYSIAGGQTQTNYEGDRTAKQLHAYFSETTPQFWYVSTFYIHRFSTIDDRQLRGGPAIKVPTSHFIETDVTTDSRHVVTANAGVSYYWDDKGGVSPYAYLNASYRPVSNVSVSFGPSWNPSRNYAQYVTAISDSTATGFYGTRYVVSNLEQRTLGLDTRLNVTFSPTMSLQLYVQPFFASGNYYDFKEYLTTRTTETAVYGKDRGTITSTRDAGGMVTQYAIDPDGIGGAKPFTIGNPNFSQQSLRGNAVFRWEYRPGSVLYVAWTHSRFADSAFGDLDLQRDRSALLATRPDNIFLVKASWWLAR
jgi:hypothetical protein